MSGTATATDYRTIFDYEGEPKEFEIPCNLCGGSHATVLSEVDRFGYPQPAVRCQNCGLVYLAPRMTPEAYKRFYETGAYRRLVSAYHGREINEKTLVREQESYARRLGGLLQAWADDFATLLDVGGSTGVVARILAERLSLKATVLDPAPLELAEAKDMETIPGTVEDFDPKGRTWDLVTLCQSVDHLLDPLGSLGKIHALLPKKGLFWLDALDFDRSKLVKIDHPYNFTEKTLRAMLQKAGFFVVGYDRRGDHVGFVCQP